MSGQIARLVVGSFQKTGRTEPQGSEELSYTEQEVLQLLARGLLYKEVAEALGLPSSTIRSHLARGRARITSRLHKEGLE